MDNDSLEKEFLNDVKLREWSNWTIKSCNYSINLLRRSSEDKSFIETDKNDLRSFLMFLKERKGRNGEVSSETIRKHINNLSSFFEFLEDEDYIRKSPVPNFRRKYLKNGNRKGTKNQQRQIINLQQMKLLIGSILDPQDRATYMVFAKTGIRAQELISLDINDISMDDMTLTLKPTGKRKRMSVFFDYEVRRALSHWLNMRKEIAKETEKAVFVTNRGTRMSHVILNRRLKKYASIIGFHNEESKDLEKKFTCHCFRHFFTTELLNSGMDRDFVKELRGDSRSETIDIYRHITSDELKREYLQHIPKFDL